MQIGCLGDIIFQVSSDVIKTIDNMQWSGSARYSEHKRHMKSALTEFTGLDADTMTFNIEVSVYLGSKPMKEIVKIWKYEREGKVLPLVIGEKVYGKYKWTIKKHRVKAKTFDGKGNVTGASVSIDLLEYLKS